MVIRKLKLREESWGFSLVVMGFMGEDALKRKLDYIRVFNKMVKELSDQNGTLQYPGLVGNCITKKPGTLVKPLIIWTKC